MQITFLGSNEEFLTICAIIGAGSINTEQINRIERNTEKIMSDQQVTIQNIKDGFQGAVTGFADVDNTLDSVVTLIQQLKDKPQLATQEDLDDLASLITQGKSAVTDAQAKMAGILPATTPVQTPPSDGTPINTTPVVEPDPTAPVGTMPTAVDDTTPING